MARSNIPLRKWAIAIYLCLTSLKSVSSMKLHRDLGISQPAAWFMLHRIREAWAAGGSDGGFSGPVEVDETYVGGRRANMSNAKRKALADTGRGLPYHHEAVKHSVAEYVRGKAHTNGVESFWSMLKRAHKGTFHKISPKHLDRYVQEFAAKHTMRESDTIAQMRDTAARLIGRNLFYRDLIADNGLPSGARA